nr:Hint domain-containing protein [Paracoccus saliphilus]
MPYTAPIIFTGEHIAHCSKLSQIGNPGDSDFAMILRNVRAIGSADDVFRLVWTKNVDASADGFLNGQFWSIQKYDPAQDPDGNPSVGNAGWPAPGTGYLYSDIQPRPHAASGLGGGAGHIVFHAGGNDYLILDISRSFSQVTTDLTYSGTSGSAPASLDSGNLTFSAVSALCYLRGTLIMTDRGEVPVEHLREGDMVLCRIGGLREIRWIGRQSFAGHKVFGKEAIRFAPGAIDQGMPRRPLLVSPGHSVLIGNTLMLAADLVNGITVTREASRERWDYFQLDLGVHDLVLADGAWSESFADWGTFRDSFDNASDFRRRFPDHLAPEIPQLCAPRPVEGPVYAAALQAMARRALTRRGPVELGQLEGRVTSVAAPCRVEGWVRDSGLPGQPVELEVMLEGKIIGTTIACLHMMDAERRGVMAFRFEDHHPLSAEQLKRLVVRRSIDGQRLAGVADRAPGVLAGHLDLVADNGRLEGWARDESHPADPVVLEVRLGDEVLGTLVACRPRRDMTEAGLGQCAFFFDCGRRLTRQEAIQLQLCRMEDGSPLSKESTRLPAASTLTDAA